jgi:hypothetical protein
LRRVNPFSPGLVAFWCLLTAATLIFFIRPNRVHRRRLPAFIPMAALVFVAVAMCDGCGVTATNGNPPPVGTSPGMYSIVVTATGNGNVTATTTVNLTVN